MLKLELCAITSFDPRPICLPMTLSTCFTVSTAYHSWQLGRLGSKGTESMKHRVVNDDTCWISDNKKTGPDRPKKTESTKHAHVPAGPAGLKKHGKHQTPTRPPLPSHTPMSLLGLLGSKSTVGTKTYPVSVSDTKTLQVRIHEVLWRSAALITSLFTQA